VDGSRDWTTYLVEHYRPGEAAEALLRAAEALRASAAELEAEGTPLRYRGSTVVPADDGFISTFEAASEAAVREAYVRAGCGFDRISPALSVDA
jgi:hypothetical protein